MLTAIGINAVLQNKLESIKVAGAGGVAQSASNNFVVHFTLPLD